MGPASDLVSLVTEQAKQLSLPAPLLATKLFCERLKDVGKGGMRQQVDSVATAAVSPARSMGTWVLCARVKAKIYFNYNANSALK